MEDSFHLAAGASSEVRGAGALAPSGVKDGTVADCLRSALERISKARPDRLDHSVDVAIIERVARIARSALAAHAKTTPERSATLADLEAAQRSLRDHVLAAADVPPSDDTLMELAREECANFRWPSTALSIMRKAIAAAGVLGNDVARCIAVIEALRDDHCAATQQDADQQNHCQADGSDGCEFVAAWNEAIERLRTLGVRATTARSGADNE